MQRQKPSIPPRTPRRQEEPSPRPVSLTRGSEQMPSAAGFPPRGAVQRGRVRTHMTPRRYRPAMKRSRSLSSSDESGNESGNDSRASHESMQSADERGLETDSEGDSSDGTIDTSQYSPPYEPDPSKRIVVVSGPIRRPEPARSVGPAAMSACPVAMSAGAVATPGDPSAKPAHLAARPAYAAANPAAKPAVPATKPAVSAAKPAVPAAKPAFPAAKSAVPAAKPAVPAAKPAVPAAKPAVPPAIPVHRQIRRSLMTMAEKEALLRKELRIPPYNKSEKNKNIKQTPVRHHVNICGRVDNQVYYDYAYTNHLSTPDNTVYFRYNLKNSSTSEGSSSSSGNSEAKVIVEKVETCEDFQLASKPELVLEPEAKRAKEGE